MQKYLRPTPQPAGVSLGLAFLRVVSGVAFLQHGWPKIQDPFGWLSSGPFPEFMLGIAALCEFIGGLLLVLGLLTPVAAIGIGVTMAGAVWWHFTEGDPFVSVGRQSYELALMHMASAVLLLFAGPGGLSLDAALFGSNKN